MPRLSSHIKIAGALIWLLTTSYLIILDFTDSSQPFEGFAYEFHDESVPNGVNHRSYAENATLPNTTLYAIGDATPPELLAPYPLWVHGSWLLIQHSDLDYHVINHQLKYFKERLNTYIAVVALDSGWQHDLSVWQFHPTKFPRVPANGSSWMSLLERVEGTKVILWASGLIPLTDIDYEGCRNLGFFIHDQNSGEALVFTWNHREEMHPGNRQPHSVEGSLLDMTHPGVKKYLESKIQSLIDAGVGGLQLGAIDALIKLVRVFVTYENVHMDSHTYSKLYYRTFHDIGTRLAGGRSFAVMAPAVDTHYGYPFSAFAPIDAAYISLSGAGQPSTFYGFRMSILSLAHAAYHGFINPSIAIGGNPGLDPMMPPPSHTMEGSHIDSLLESHGSCHRRRELKLRWLQLGVWLPFLVLAGPHSVNRTQAVDAEACAGHVESVLDYDSGDDLHRAALIRRRCQNILYHATNAARTFYSRLVKGDHWHDDQEGKSSTLHKHHHDSWTVWPVGADPSHSDIVYTTADNANNQYKSTAPARSAARLKAKNE